MIFSFVSSFLLNLNPGITDYIIPISIILLGVTFFKKMD
jgi:hypothetical protein